jgi:predicted nucleic acid-binding protein
MTFSDFLRGDSLFLDANILIYHFEPHPVLGPSCTQLLTRIEQQELIGFSSTHILTEVAHRLMMIEASHLPGGSTTNIKQRLQRKPATVQGLTQFRIAIEGIRRGRIQFLTISPASVVEATKVSQKTGLFSNDALLVAVMEASGLSKLASNDADFDRVPGITRYAPA